MKPRTAVLRTLGLALLATLACGLPAVAEEPAATSYNIELVIFRATSAPGATVESWGAETGAANSVAGDEASSGSSQVGHFVSLLPASGYQLSEIEGRLRSSGAYVPIAHLAWSQTASAWGTRAGFPVQRLGAEAPGLSGTVVRMVQKGARDYRLEGPLKMRLTRQLPTEEQRFVFAEALLKLLGEKPKTEAVPAPQAAAAKPVQGAKSAVTAAKPGTPAGKGKPHR